MLSDRIDEIKAECLYRALNLGLDEALERVIQAYCSGHLTQHAATIEQYYLPQFQQRKSEQADDDDYEQEIEED